MGGEVRLTQLDKLVDCLRHGQIEAIQVAIPKTATRHLQDHVNLEYGLTGWALNQGCNATFKGPRAWALHVLGHTVVRLVNISLAANVELPSCAPVVDSQVAETHDIWSKVFDAADAAGIVSFTMVRDPVEQVLSMFSQAAGWRSHPGGWEDFLRRFASSQYIRNYQTAYLAGRRFQYTTHFSPGRRGAADALLCACPVLEASRADLDAVLSRIERGHLLAGVVERFGESVQHIAASLAWELPLPDSGPQLEPLPRGEFSHEPSRVMRPWDKTEGRLQQYEVPADIMDLIRENTHLDAELYRFVAARLGGTRQGDEL